MHLFHRRQGQMGDHQCYFYTETINGFKPLLNDNACKEIIISSWKHLLQLQLATIYGYVIMPNHIHLLWSIQSSHRKESVTGSFSKYTAHQFKKYLVLHNPLLLESYTSDKNDRQYQFWKRDPLAVPVTSENAFLQKLEYMHNNPVKEKWGLCQYPEEYRWSSAGFYLNGVDEFEMVTHYMD